MENFDQYRFMANRSAPDFRHMQDWYRNDADFHATVDLLYAMIDKFKLSPVEVRSAAMFACYRHQMFTVDPIVFPKDSP